MPPDVQRRRRAAPKPRWRRENAPDGSMQDKCFKTRHCIFYQQGRCDRGDACCFAHNDTELRDMPDLKKTKLCTVWRKGHCRAGSQCNYAHGRQDLRNPDFEDADTAAGASPFPLSEERAWSPVERSPSSKWSASSPRHDSPESPLQQLMSQLSGSPLSLDMPSFPASAQSILGSLEQTRGQCRSAGNSYGRNADAFQRGFDPFYVNRELLCWL